jgi:hypothetical protein
MNRRRNLLIRLRLFSRRARRFIILKILHADDPPHRLALGVALGMFVAFTPTIGFQMLIVVFLAWLLRANKVVGLPVVWISNPATMIPIYYTCYVVGRVLLGEEPIARRWWAQLARPPHGFWDATKFYWERLMQIAEPLWIGCLVVGLLTAYPTYLVVYHTTCWYRMRRWGSLESPHRRMQHSATDSPGHPNSKASPLGKRGIRKWQKNGAA